MSIVIAAVGLVLQIVSGTNDDDEYTLRVTRRIARRQGATPHTDVPGIIYLEIDGLALPVLQRALRDGSAPTMARWISDLGYHLAEWETDLSSQTGASQAGILLGSNEDIPAFRWVEKETSTMMVCSSAADCVEIERRHSTGVGLLADGGASRGNLLSGEAEDAILTVSRMDAEKRANPGLPRVLRERVQRHAAARALPLGGRARVGRGRAAEAPRRPPARPPGRDLSVPARRDVRVHPRPDRLRRADGHDARAAGGVRDVRQLRRGRPPLGPGAGRHLRGAAQARPAVRPDRARPQVRAASVRDRRALRSRPDAGRDVQAAPRVRARRARLTLARARERGRVRGRRRAAGGRRPRRRGGHRQGQQEAAEERRVRSRRRRARVRQPRADLPDGVQAAADARGASRSAIRT